MSSDEDAAAFVRAAVGSFLEKLGPELPAPGTPSGQACEFCGLPIVVAQHYVRVVVLAATAGLEDAFDTPTVLWSGIFDHPSCGGIALAKAGGTDPVLLDVFEH